MLNTKRGIVHPKHDDQLMIPVDYYFHRIWLVCLGNVDIFGIRIELAAKTDNSSKSLQSWDV